MANSFKSGGRSLYGPRFVARWLRKQPVHPDSFQCGIRVVSGHVEGESSRCRYRQSALDSLVTDGVRSLNHGDRALRLLVAPDAEVRPDATRARLGFVTFPAVEQTSGAGVEVSVMEYELVRFGL